MGLFVCFGNQVTRGMLETAKRQGYFREEQFGTQYDKIQIISVDDLLENKFPNIPYSTTGIFKSAQRTTKEQDTQVCLLRRHGIWRKTVG